MVMVMTMTTRIVQDVSLASQTAPWARLTLEDVMVGLVLQNHLSSTVLPVSEQRFKSAWHPCTRHFIAKHFDDGGGHPRSSQLVLSTHCDVVKELIHMTEYSLAQWRAGKMVARTIQHTKAFLLLLLLLLMMMMITSACVCERETESHSDPQGTGNGHDKLQKDIAARAFIEQTLSMLQGYDKVQVVVVEEQE